MIRPCLLVVVWMNGRSMESLTVNISRMSLIWSTIWTMRMEERCHVDVPPDKNLVPKWHHYNITKKKQKKKKTERERERERGDKVGGCHQCTAFYSRRCNPLTGPLFLALSPWNNLGNKLIASSSFFFCFFFFCSCLFHPPPPPERCSFVLKWLCCTNCFNWSLLKVSGKLMPDDHQRADQVLQIASIMILIYRWKSCLFQLKKKKKNREIER